MNTSNSTIADRIKIIRGSETLAAFSNAIDCNINTLRSYERGLSNPNFEFIQLICSVKNISTDWLVFGRGTMRPGEQPQPAEPAPQQPVNTLETTGCVRCAKLEAKLEKVEQQRDDLMQENRQLLRENGSLNTEVAVQRERLKSLSGRSVAVDCA